MLLKDRKTPQLMAIQTAEGSPGPFVWTRSFCCSSYQITLELLMFKNRSLKV